jgi:hypothetical protein
MKKVILIVAVLFLAVGLKAQTRFGFGQIDYDNWNVNDPKAHLLLLVWPQNNDTLDFEVGADIFVLDGTAKAGIDFNMSTSKWTFPIGTNIFDSSNRKKIAYNFVPNTTFWGKKDFAIKLGNLQGVTSADLLNGQDLLRVIIDYDGTGIGLPKLSVHDYRLYPIPASTMLYIGGVNPTAYKIYDLSGRLAQEGGMLQSSIDVSNLGNGLYVLYAQTDKGMIVQKFLKD